MSSIDERVVNMTFNNKQFEAGVKQTTSSLDGLKKSLDMADATKGLNDLDAAGKKFSLAGIAQGVDTLVSKFGALGIAGVTALVNITNRAVDAGLQFIKSFTFEPINDGFKEYETNMNSIQTILANTARYGTNLQQVNAALDELNTYADKTIYSFSDMTSNIGLFTNAGIRIEDATAMIKGFSNAAAASGTSAQGAAGAAYQLSQALSAGTIRLMDWRSLTNVGMGNKNMQDGLIQIADAMGTLTAHSITAADVQKDFNGSLEKGWLSADVMSTYLRIMAGDMDAAQLSALGLSDATIQTFLAQQKTAEEAATKVRTLTQLIGTIQEAIGSSWSSTFRIMFGDFNQATELFTNVNNTIGGLISSMGDARNKLLQQFADLGGRTAIINALANAFKALMAFMKPITEAFGEIFPAPTAQQLLNFAKGLESFTKSLIITGKTADELKRTFKGVFAIFDIAFTIIGKVIGVFAKLFGVATKGSGSFLELTARIGDWLVKLDDAIKNSKKLTQFFEDLGNVLAVPIAFIGALGDAVVNLFKNFQGFGKIDLSGIGKTFDALKSRLDPLKGVGEAIIGVFNAIVTAFKAVVKFFTPVAQALGNFFADLGKNIANSITTGDFNNVLNILNTGLFAAIVLAIKKFLKGPSLDINFKGGFLDGLKESLESLTGVFKSMQQQIKAKTLLTIAGAIGILAASIVALSMIDSVRLTFAVGAMAALFGELVGAMALLDKVASTKSALTLPFLASGLLILSVAMVALAGAVAIMSAISWEGLAKGILALALAMGIMVGAVMLLSLVPLPALLAGSVAIIAISGALVIAATGLTILAGAMKLFATLSWEDIGKNLTILSAGLLILAVSLTAMAATLPGAAGLTVAAVGLTILAGALKLMGTLSWETIGKGMTILSAGLLILAVALTAMIASLPGAAALVVAAAGLTVFGAALIIFGNLSWESIGKGLTILSAGLLILAVALTAMIASLPGAAALTVAAAALVVLGGALLIFGKLSWEAIGKSMTILSAGLLIMAVGLTAMLVALPGAVALTVAAAALAVLAPVLLLFGQMSWDDIGRGLTMLGATLAIIAAAGVLLVVALPGLIGLGVAIALIGAGALAAGIGISMFAASLVLLSVAGAAGAAAFTVIVQALINLIPSFMAQLAQGVIDFTMVLVNAAPQFLIAMTTLIMTLLQAINTTAPAILDTLWNLIVMLTDKVVAGVPFFVAAAGTLIISFLNGIAAQIPGIAAAGTNLIIQFINAMQKSMNKIADAGMTAVVKFINGLADSIDKHSGEMRSAGANLARAIIDGMTGGLASGVGKLIQKAKDMAGNVINAAKSALGIHSPSREFFEIGGYSTEGLANGLEATSKVAEQSAAKVGVNTVMSLKKSIDGLSDKVALNMDLQPTITPVLDLSNVKKSAAQVAGMLPNAPTLTLNKSYDAAVQAVRGAQQNDEAQKELVAAGSGDTLIFNQTNNSPKALSQAEIYRQTKNQISIAKDELDKK